MRGCGRLTSIFSVGIYCKPEFAAAAAAVVCIYAPRADYHGSSINKAARFMDASADAIAANAAAAAAAVVAFLLPGLTITAPPSIRQLASWMQQHMGARSPVSWTWH
jgi:hypothetical protein